METGKPWVRMKAAASLDGKTALPNGQSQWITGAEAGTMVTSGVLGQMRY
jgi:diaminohydroxyphosphoribosylaminopyrimidine deaminase/5-amino-6-(5-phosphoribosylamino)uracil reductase